MDTESEKLKNISAVIKEKRCQAEAELKAGREREFERLRGIFAHANIEDAEMRFIHKLLLCNLIIEEGDGGLCADILSFKNFLAAHGGARFDPFDGLHLAYALRCCRGEETEPSPEFRRFCALVQALDGGCAEGADESPEPGGKEPEAAEAPGLAEDNAAAAQAELCEAGEGELFSWEPLPGEDFFGEHAPSYVRFFGCPLVWEKPSEAESERGGGWDKVIVLLLRLMTDRNYCSRYCSDHRIALPKLFCDDADFRSRRFRGMARQDRFNSLIKSEHDFRRPEYICEDAALEKAAPHREKWELFLKILHLLQVDGDDIIIKYVKI